VIAFVFHFATDWAMNLFLFQWLMMVGLLSFTVPADWAALKRRARLLATLARRRKDEDLASAANRSDLDHPLGEAVTAVAGVIRAWHTRHR
jgi:hypothetical protein